MESKIQVNENPSRTVTALKAHLSLNVRNVEASIRFYRKMLGIEPSKVRTGYAKFDVQNPPLNLALNEAPVTSRGALSHLGIQLASTEDVLAMRETWKEAGLSTHDEMQTDCCYAVQDKSWVRDPDGNEWEAFVVQQDNLTVSSACCGVAEETCAAPLTQISLRSWGTRILHVIYRRDKHLREAAPRAVATIRSPVQEKSGVAECGKAALSDCVSLTS